MEIRLKHNFVKFKKYKILFLSPNAQLQKLIVLLKIVLFGNCIPMLKNH